MKHTLKSTLGSWVEVNLSRGKGTVLDVSIHRHLEYYEASNMDSWYVQVTLYFTRNGFKFIEPFRDRLTLKRGFSKKAACEYASDILMDGKVSLSSWKPLN